MNEYQSTSFPQIFLKTSNYFWILRSPCVLDSEWLIWQTAALNVIYSTSLGSSVFCFLFWRCLIVQYRHNWWYFLLSLIWRIFNALLKQINLYKILLYSKALIVYQAQPRENPTLPKLGQGTIFWASAMIWWWTRCTVYLRIQKLSRSTLHVL